MKTLWDRWLRLLAVREGAEPLAACRIMAGIGLTASVLFVLANGMIGVLWVNAEFGGYRDLGHGPWLVRILGGPNPVTVWILSILTVLAGIALTFGLRTRLAAAMGLILFNTLIRLNFHDGSAYDSLLTNQLFLLIWAGSGETWSLDCRLRQGSWSASTLVAAWPRYLMILQLVLCYTSTGLQKVTNHWLPGGDLSAVYYVLQDPFWRRWELTPWLGHVFPLTEIGTAMTWWFEVLTPLLLLAFYYRATRERPGRLRKAFNRWDFRLWYAIVGISFHVILHVTMRIGPFSWIILSYYPALWSAREWARRKA